MGLAFSDTQEAIDTIGLREDLTDLISMISPTDTPFQTMCGRTKATARKHEWQMDLLAAAADNAVGEGHKVLAVDALVPTERLNNHCQISTKTLSLTGTVEAETHAGVANELSYQLSKRSQEIKRDLEFGYVGQTTVALMASVAATQAGGIRRSAAVQAMFSAAFTKGGTSLSGAHTNRIGSDSGGFDGTVFDAPTDGTQRPLLESQLKGVIQGAWHNGGDPTLVMVGPFNKTVISEMTGGSTRTDHSEDKKLVASIDVYVSDFGTHTIVPNKFQRDRDLFAFTTDLWKIAYLRPFEQFALAKVGDSEERELLVECCLEGANQSGNGLIADLNAA